MSNDSDIQKLLEDAWVRRRENNYKEAETLVTKAKELCKEDDFIFLGRIYHVTMQFEYDRKNYTKALQLCQESLSYYKKSKDLNKIAHSTRHIADLEYHLGNYDNSEEFYKASLKLYRENKNTNSLDMANALRGYAILLEKNKKGLEAIQIWTGAKQYYEASNIKAGINEANKKIKLLQTKYQVE